MDTSLSERTIIIRGAEAIYRQVQPDSLVFTSNIQVTWITDPKTILAIVSIDVNPNWGMNRIGGLETAVADFATFLKLFGVCLLMTFRNSEVEFSDMALNPEEIAERNQILSGLNFADAHSKKWREILENRRYYRTPKWINSF